MMQDMFIYSKRGLWSDIETGRTVKIISRRFTIEYQMFQMLQRKRGSMND